MEGTIDSAVVGTGEVAVGGGEDGSGGVGADTGIGGVFPKSSFVREIFLKVRLYLHCSEPWIPAALPFASW